MKKEKFVFGICESDNIAYDTLHIVVIGKSDITFGEYVEIPNDLFEKLKSLGLEYLSNNYMFSIEKETVTYYELEQLLTNNGLIYDEEFETYFQNRID